GMGGSICHIKQPTPTLPNHGGRKVKSPRPQRFLVGEGRISMRKLSIRNSGEGATHTNTPPQKGLPSLAREGVGMGLFPARGKRAAFTLAEVLITLAVIGVVAAMTLPTLIARINEKADSNQKAVIEAKLIQGLNMLDLHGGMNDTYSSTAEFVEELGKYMKITAVCDGTTKAFTECLPYSELNYIQNGEQKSIELTKINSASSLNLPTGGEKDFMNPVAIVLGDGTPIILSYDKKCISDPDSVKVDNKQIHSCVAGIYDFNGSRKPNLYGGDEHTRNDLIGFNGAKIEKSYITIGGVKIIEEAKVPTPVSCSDYIGKSGYEAIKSCEFNNNDDYWVGAMVECKNQGGRLPNASELAKIAKAIYNDNSISESENFNETDPTANEWDKSVTAKLGIEDSASWFDLWGDLEDGSELAWCRDFRSSYTARGGGYRYDDDLRVVCVVD
ncbi:type II secretion system protein, partial [bacterium]|nr:type II secretion system protein [bacterium]